ncbi:MAG: hypothetical protein ACREOH_20890 [Candidatus Entotheonellia bacterium]
MSPGTLAAESSGAAILNRVLKAHASRFTAEAAQSILQLKFDQNDIDRINALAEKNRRGILTETEQQELQSYLLVGHLLDLLHSKARLLSSFLESLTIYWGLVNITCRMCRMILRAAESSRRSESLGAGSL